MAKGKADSATPDAFVQLTARIEAVCLFDGPATSSSSQNTWITVVQQLTPLLNNALRLTFAAVETDDSAVLKYGLDSLRFWTKHTSSLFSEPSIALLDLHAKIAVLPADTQISLAKLAWSTCLSERSQISTRSKALTEALLQLLHRIYTSQSTSASQSKLLPYHPEAPFLSDLVHRSVSQLDRKQSPVILEIMQAAYGSAPFMVFESTGLADTDSAVYDRIIAGLGTLDGGAARRAKLALSFLAARAFDLGCSLTSQSKVPAAAASMGTAWQEWSAIWLTPLSRSLQSGGERLRAGLATNHLASLFELDNRNFSALLDSLMTCDTADQNINVESIFVVLRTGKMQGHCRISDVNDFSTEPQDDGSVQVLIPAAMLEDCILSSTSELQIATLSLVVESKTPAAPLSPSEFGILRTFFPYSLTITNPSARGDLRGFFVKLLTRLRASTYALDRDSGKITRIKEEERYPEERKRLAFLQESLTESKAFLEWLYLLLRRSLHPGASYQSSISALTFLDLLLESGIDPQFSAQPAANSQQGSNLSKNAGLSLLKTKQVFVQEFPFALDLISPSLVQLLLTCCESTYDDIQARSLTMLARFPAPLAGLKDQSIAAERILGKAARLMLGTRDFQCAAAARLVQLYQQVYMFRLGHTPMSLLSFLGVDGTHMLSTQSQQPTLALINDLCEFLSYHLQVAEAGHLLEAANAHPIHGTLVTLQELFAPMRLADMSSSERKEYKMAVERTQHLIDRTWQVTKAVLCNSAPEGNTVGSAEESATDGTTGLDQPSHETARVMRLIEAENKAALMQIEEESNAGPKHQVILSYCWRGMKEASALLGVLITATLSTPARPKAKKGSAVDADDSSADLWREVFDVDLIQGVGDRFNHWLTQVRHRGAFSTIYPAYCNAVTAIVRSEAAEIRSLPQQWTASFLDGVAQPGSQTSITRRSAGISYAVLALLSAQTSKTDTRMLKVTVQRLTEILSQDSADRDNMSVAAVHTLNILRVLVMDGSLSEFMSPFLGKLLEITISKFKSRFWGLRNGSMMLFSSLCIRIFGSRNTNRDVKEAKMPVDDFFTAFPNADPFFRQVLSQEVENKSGNEEGGESSLFAILMLFSKMRAPQETSYIEKFGAISRSYQILLKQCFSNKTWKIREIAAKAYAAFVPAVDAPKHVQDMLQQLRLSDQVRNNKVHGTLLTVQRLIKTISESDCPSPSLHEPLASILAELSKWPVRPGAYQCMVTQAAMLEVCQDFAALMRKLDHPLTREAYAAWTSWSKQFLLSNPEELAEHIRMPGGPALLGVCTRVLLQAAFHASPDAREFVPTCEQLLASPCSDVRLALLEALSGEEALSTSTALLMATPEDISLLLKSLHIVVKQQTEGIWHRTYAAELLHLLAAPAGLHKDAVLSKLVLSEWNGLLETQQLAQLARTTTCVPLREALLPYLADLCSLLLASPKSEPDVAVMQVIEDWARIVATCADDSQSVQSREAAGLSIRVLGPTLFPPAKKLYADSLRTSEALFRARIAAINLLTDDDEDVRTEAAAMIGETVSLADTQLEAPENGMKTKRAAIQRVARQGGASSDVSTDRSWLWMTRYYSDSHLWTNFVWDQLLPSKAALEQMFEEAFSANMLLFVEEKPNQFRDPESNIRRAAAFAQTQPISIDIARLDEAFNRLAAGLKQLAATLEETDSTPEPEATHMLALRLILGLDAILTTAPSEWHNDDRDQAVSIAATLSANLGIHGPTFQTHSSNGAKAAAYVKRKQQAQVAQTRYNIAMVSDFFYPNVGGVEGHIYFVGEKLLTLGHKVIVITHAYAPDRVGVRYLSNGLKIYYVPYQVIARQDTLPNFFSLFPMIRSIYVREQIQIVHGHQALSSMAHEGILHARSMGLKTCFTDHSLFGFADTASILTNKLFRFALSDVDQVVCVSHTGKENTTLRGNLNPSKVSVIPNAVVTEQFQPDPSRAQAGRLTIVVLSRLMYRKGIDLLIAAIPRLCAAHPDIYFLIGGDGPKRIELEQMRERFMLQDRVELCGTVRQGEVRAHLTRGTIFLNTSLTEAFGTGIIEAACAGLFVVSTRVGGVPEVLPQDMIRLARPEEDDVVRATEDAIQHIRLGRHDPWAYHNAVKSMYSWDDVAQRLQHVYDRAMAADFPSSTERFSRYYAGGPIAGKIFCIIVAVDLLFLRLLQWWLPDNSIDRCASLHSTYRSDAPTQHHVTESSGTQTAAMQS